MKKLSVSAIALLISGLALADCPAPSEIHLKCGSNLSHTICNWQAPWYEGFTQGNVKPLHDAAISNFIKVNWGRGDGRINGKGSTFCYYKANDGTIVEMSQNNWGGIAKPKTNNWFPGFDERGFPVKVCMQNCHFHYGS